MEPPSVFEFIGRTIPIGLVVTAAVSIFTAGKLYQNQTNWNDSATARADRIETEMYRRFDEIYKLREERGKSINTRMDNVDRRFDQQSDTINKLDLRLTSDERLALSQQAFFESLRAKR